MEESFERYLVHPSRFIIYGPSGSGKTSFIENFLKNLKYLFNMKFDNIIYCSGQSNLSFDRVNNVKIKEINIIDENIIDNFDENTNNLLIIDDNMHNVVNDILISDLFTKKSHHLNITVVLVLQNLFPKSKFMRDISSNSTYIVLMSNPREILQIKTLGMQIDGAKDSFVIKCFLDATKNKPFSYLLLDFNQNTSDKIRVRTNIFEHEKPTIVYVKLD